MEIHITLGEIITIAVMVLVVILAYGFNIRQQQMEHKKEMYFKLIRTLMRIENPEIFADKAYAVDSALEDLTVSETYALYVPKKIQVLFAAWLLEAKKKTAAYNEHIKSGGDAKSLDAEYNKATDKKKDIVFKAIQKDLHIVRDERLTKELKEYAKKIKEELLKYN